MSDTISISPASIYAAARSRRDVRELPVMELDLNDVGRCPDPLQKIIVAAGVATVVLAAAKIFFTATALRSKAVDDDAPSRVAAAPKTAPLIVESSETELTDDETDPSAEYDMLSPTERRFTPPTSLRGFNGSSSTTGVFVEI